MTSDPTVPGTAGPATPGLAPVPDGSALPAVRGGEVEAARLAQITQRAEAATPGPWSLEPLNAGWVQAAPNNGWEVLVCRGFAHQSVEERTANAEFIAAAREDVPYLVSEVERLTAELARRTRERDDARAAGGHYRDRAFAAEAELRSAGGQTEPSDADEAVAKIAARYAQPGTARFAINDFRDWLAAAGGMHLPDTGAEPPIDKGCMSHSARHGYCLLPSDHIGDRHVGIGGNDWPVRAAAGVSVPDPAQEGDGAHAVRHAGDGAE